MTEDQENKLKKKSIVSHFFPSKIHQFCHNLSHKKGNDVYMLVKLVL